MKTHGYGGFNPVSNVHIRLYCGADNDFHRKYGKTWLGTFLQMLPAWREVDKRSRRTENREKAWWDSLSTDQREAVEFGGFTGTASPYSGQEGTGVRPPALTYLRGDTPATGNDQRHIADALTDGVRHSSRGGHSPRLEDLDGRAKLDKHCTCGEPPIRARGEDVWPIFDALAQAGKYEIEATTLRDALRRAKGH